MIKVLQIGMTSNLGGLETYLRAQYRMLDRNIIRYDFVNLDDRAPIIFEDEIKANRDKIYSVVKRRINPILHYLQMSKIIFRYGKEYKAIVLNTCHLYYVFPLFIALLVGIPMRVIHSHDSGDEIKISKMRKLLIAFNRALLNLSVTHYWACSQLAGKWMFGNKQFTVIHNAIDIKKFTYNDNVRTEIRKELQIEDKFVVGNVARFSYQKNHEFLLDIFKEIVKKEPKSVLLLIGDYVLDDTYLRKAKEKVRQLKLENKVIFLGMRKDVNKFYQAMDCFVFPSHFEGMGIAGLEAQAAGLPCYFSDTLPRDLQVTDLAHYLPLKDAAVWAGLILQGKGTIRRNMAQTLVNHGYDITKEVKKVENLYLESK
jgi:glycosyltransferase involved in cell wall biosynthesis